MKTSCEFKFGFWDLTARADAHFSASQNQPFARVEDINLEEEADVPNIVTLEPDFGWPLDGSKEWMPDNASTYSWGWWSLELSGEDNSFSNQPSLTITFYDDAGVPTPHSSAGITFDFVATLPGRINIKWYGRDNEILADRDFSPDSFKYFCDCPVEDYYKVLITVHSMSYSNRYFRVSSILFGALEVLDSSRVTRAVDTEEISPVSLILPIGKLEVSFYSSNDRFSLLDPNGVYKMFQFGQELSGYKTVDGKKTEVGKYYLQDASGSTDAVTVLSCANIIGVLDTIECNGGIYTNVPLETFLSDLLTPEGVLFEIDAALCGVEINGYLPICSKRAALQQLAFAIGAIINPSQSGCLRVFPAPDTVSRTIGPERKIVGHKVKMEPLVTQVDVTAHQYTLSAEMKEITKATLEPGTHTIKFSGPVSVQTVSGASVTVNHPNYCVINVATAGEVILSGYEYVDTTTVHTVQTDPLPAGARPSVKSVSSATLVDRLKAATAAQRLYEYYQLRYTDEGRLLPGDEQVSERVELSSIGGRTITGYVQRVVTDLAGGCLESVVVRGE